MSGDGRYSDYRHSQGSLRRAAGQQARPRGRGRTDPAYSRRQFRGEGGRSVSPP
ncbi:hypothetical protein ACFPM0_30600 [Pseudonocardia sulfidoxydans]|uniref:hypothetical protein n=1 Tax=Pseudonocardia sulfidoxydans TaxID=54011 RepID=UPI00361BB3E5